MLLSLTSGPIRAAEPIGSGTLHILGTYLEIDPPTQVVPKNIATALNTRLVFPEINGQTSNCAASGLPSGYKVVGEFSGPGIDTPRLIEATPDEQLSIPALFDTGKYVVDNIRLVDAKNNTVMPTVPSYATSDVIEKIIVTQVHQGHYLLKAVRKRLFSLLVMTMVDANV